MKEKINTLFKQAEDIWRKLWQKEIQAKIEKYEKEINQKNFWNDPKRAQEVIKAQSILKTKLIHG